jgi:hypothetical protein
MPAHYIADLIDDGQQPFAVVQKFVAAQNHILKYLGLRCLSLMDEEFWEDSWLDGTAISEAIAVSCGDATLAEEV